MDFCGANPFSDRIRSVADSYAKAVKELFSIKPQKGIDLTPDELKRAKEELKKSKKKQR